MIIEGLEAKKGHVCKKLKIKGKQHRGKGVGREREGGKEKWDQIGVRITERRKSSLWQ